MVVCDGKKFYAAIQDLPGQVLERAAPANLTLNRSMPTASSTPRCEADSPARCRKCCSCWPTTR